MQKKSNKQSINRLKNNPYRELFSTYQINMFSTQTDSYTMSYKYAVIFNDFMVSNGIFNY